MFNKLRVYLTNREYNKQLRRYKKRKKTFRKAMTKQLKEFCPWSGWYMHKMITTMLEFYNETYEAGDCCFSCDERVRRIAAQTKRALDYAHNLDAYEDLEEEELIAMAEKEPGFKKYVEKYEKKLDIDTSKKQDLLYGVAWDYFEKKYTSGMYAEIGKHIWEWCD